jgi:exopolysaccharide biosynthesis WecB/TagA/CpsF family protein
MSAELVPIAVPRGRFLYRTIEVLGVHIACLGGSSALEEIESLFEQGDCSLVAYANAHTLNLAYRDMAYRNVLRRAHLVLNDGIGLAIAARLQGREFPENLNGSDFNPRILALAARRGWRVYFVGSRPGVAADAAHRLEKAIPGLLVCGAHHGYFTNGNEERLVREIRSARADVLMVGMGNPAQEIWLDRNLKATGARVGIGVGAFFDFSADALPRAPAWMNKVGVEWVHRFVIEPRRMWRRYLIGNPVFLARAVRQSVRGM